MTTTRDILNRAADLVEQGWCQGNYEREENGVVLMCAARAISLACDESSSSIQTEIESDMAVRNKVQALGFESTIGWNDAPGRTQAEVVSLLRSVAAEQG